MGGFAADISWAAPPPADVTQRMIAMVPHRATGGVAVRSFDSATLAECHTTRADAIAEVMSVGPFSIVGDLRLWNKDRLVARAGGNGATRDMNDRRLVLKAYARTGVDFLDAVDGDFAFVIWNNEDRSVLAVRDRFGTKPLFYERSPTGIRFASEIKQLVAVSEKPPTPCDTTVAEYLQERYQATDLTFFDGIKKVRPAEYAAASESRFARTRYWTPSFDEPAGLDRADVPHLFREQLIASVQRRIESSNGTTMHVTGGLDSSSITAAATYLPDLDARISSLHTASAIFPGKTVDESFWIDKVVNRQPFSHYNFVPEIESVERYAETMWTVDGLLFNQITGMWPGTVEVASQTRSELVLMGSGGDEVLTQGHVTADLLRSGRVREYWRGLRSEGVNLGGPVIPMLWSVKQALPSAVKRPIRVLLDRRTPAQPVIARPDLLRTSETAGRKLHAELAAPSITQGRVAASMWHPRRVVLNESQEAEHARGGIDVSYPYLDRALVEFILSLSPASRPLDGNTKTLVRMGFAERIPPSVLGRTRKTIADAYLADVFANLAAEYTQRYPGVSDLTLPYLDKTSYIEAVTGTVDTLPPRSARRRLWDAWMLMEWIDGLDRYRT